MKRPVLSCWRRLLISPASHNVSLSMEQSWAGEPMYRERAWRLHLGKRSFYCVFSQDMGRWCKARMIFTCNFDFKKRWTIPSSNREGGLVQLWKDSICLSVEDWSKYCIDALIEKNTPQEWHFIGFYGEPATSKRHEAWAKLRTLNDQPHISWLCAGDFNEIARQDEKLGGAIRGHHQMQLFQDVLDECEFIDLGFIGPKFTWSKHCDNGHSIWERLDRGSAIDSWFLRYPGTWVYHLPCLSSNHCPLLINPTS